MTRAQLRGPAPARVVWDGQSHNWLPAPPDNVPTVCMARFPGVPWANIGIDGHGWAALQNRYPISRLTDQARTTGVDIWVGSGGQSDILNPAGEWGGQHTGEQAYELGGDYVAIARAAGFDVAIGIVPPMIGPNVLGVDKPTEFEAQALADLRDLIRTDPDGIYDAVVDCSVTPLDDATNGTWFDVDRTHLTPAGAQAMADLIAPALAPYIT